MDTIVNTNNALSEVALNRVETAQAISQSPATLDRLTKRGLLCPSRARGRPVCAIRETERILKATTPQWDWAV